MLVVVASAIGFLYPSTASATPVNLGTAGPSYFAVLTLGGALSFTQSDATVNSGTTVGNVGIAAKASPNPTSDLKLSSAGSITGKVYLETNSTLTNAGVITGTVYKDDASVAVTNTGTITGGVVVNNTVDAKLNQAATDAHNASTSYGALLCTICGVANINNPGANLTITGVNGVNVINLNDLKLNNGHDLILTATGSAAQFILNVSGTFNINQADILLSGDLTPDEVLINYTGSADVKTMGPGANNINAIILADHANIGFTNAIVTGEVISGGKTVQLVTGSRVNGYGGLAGAGSVPEPASLILLGSGLVIAARKRRSARRAQGGDSPADR